MTIFVLKKMKNILITGATGNIGLELIRFLSPIEDINLFAGVRNVDKASMLFAHYPNLLYRTFDFEDAVCFDSALNNIDTIFLLRPPHLADVNKYFLPLIEQIKVKGIRKVVFLSVQGAEKSKVIPHNKIEQLIVDAGLEYIFIRPSYFMQNLTTTLLGDIQTKRKIILPSGKAKFNWIDINNIAEVAAILLTRFDEFKNKPYELTGYENENFDTVVTQMNSIIARPIQFQSVSPFKFYGIKKKEGMVKGMIIVMIMLHFLPRIQKEPTISDFYEKITGKKPTSLKEFIQREKELFS